MRKKNNSKRKINFSICQHNSAIHSDGLSTTISVIISFALCLVWVVLCRTDLSGDSRLCNTRNRWEWLCHWDRTWSSVSGESCCKKTMKLTLQIHYGRKFWHFSLLIPLLCSRPLSDSVLSAFCWRASFLWLFALYRRLFRAQWICVVISLFASCWKSASAADGDFFVDFPDFKIGQSTCEIEERREKTHQPRCQQHVCDEIDAKISKFIKSTN